MLPIVGLRAGEGRRTKNTKTPRAIAVRGLMDRCLSSGWELIREGASYSKLNLFKAEQGADLPGLFQQGDFFPFALGAGIQGMQLLQLGFTDATTADFASTLN